MTLTDIASLTNDSELENLFDDVYVAEVNYKLAVADTLRRYGLEEVNV